MSKSVLCNLTLELAKHGIQAFSGSGMRPATICSRKVCCVNNRGDVMVMIGIRLLNPCDLPLIYSFEVNRTTRSVRSAYIVKGFQMTSIERCLIQPNVIDVAVSIACVTKPIGDWNSWVRQAVTEEIDDDNDSDD